jgi:hypothetical protein
MLKILLEISSALKAVKAQMERKLRGNSSIISF